jgi:hypothetical protein
LESSSKGLPKDMNHQSPDIVTARYTNPKT